MIDFSNLNNNLEGGSLTQIILIAIIAFILSSLIAFVYQKTSREIETPKYFIQSLILISIPVATVIQAIGDSLARGLGMLGALAIIRFRTTLRNPRNIVFMFTSIAIGIAAGTYGITIAIVGTIGFCIVVLLIHASPISQSTWYIVRLQFDVNKKAMQEEDVVADIQVILKNETIRTSLVKYNMNNKTNREGIVRERMSFEYLSKVKTKEQATLIVNMLSKISGVSNVRANFKEDYEKI